MRKYLGLDRLSEGELRVVRRRAKWILVRRWLRENPQVVIVALVWLGLLPVAIKLGLFEIWGIFALLFSVVLMPLKRKRVYHKGDTGPLPPL